jgi:hypothetical protein
MITYFDRLYAAPLVSAQVTGVPAYPHCVFIRCFLTSFENHSGRSD